MGNRLIKNSKLSDNQTRKIFSGFCCCESSIQLARKLKVNRHSVERMYQKIRKFIVYKNGLKISRYNLLNFKSPVNFDGDIPVVGIAFSHDNSEILCRIIGKISKDRYKRMLRKGEINREITYNMYPFNAVAIGNFDCYHFIHEKKETVDRFINFYKKIFKEYGAIRWKYYEFYLNEICWKFNRSIGATSKSGVESLLREVALFDRNEK